MRVSIVIPVLDKLSFTRQCLDRIWRNTDEAIEYEVIVVDNGSRDGTADWFADVGRFPKPLRYLRHSENLGFARANNAGARLSHARDLLFLNNDTLVQPGWLSEMLNAIDSDQSVGVVGIKQLFPYTSTIYHTGIVFTPEGRPEHLYPHLDASLPQVNEQRTYQAVTGACLLIERALFDECGGFDEAYRNGYEDVDLCMKVAARRRKIVCCTRAFIYHYGQISEGRTDDDDSNAALFAQRWGSSIRPDRDEYLIRDRLAGGPATHPGATPPRSLADDCIYLADELEQASALTWINAELALALMDRGAPVFINGQAPISPTLSQAARTRLADVALKDRPTGGIQVKWSHYWARHLNLELAGAVNFEFFVINYLFANPGAEPWDYWLQCLRQNEHAKLPLSEFCNAVLQQVGVPEQASHVWHPGYSKEIDEVERPSRSDSRFRFLTVTNSHDLERYNTLAILDAYRQVFDTDDDVTLVIKDYGASSGDSTIRRTLSARGPGAPIEYVSAFSSKRELMELYKSCDAFVSAHRGEGFGMKTLDAMACGLPVITPLFGGPTAYCREDTCVPVTFSLVPMGDCLDSRSLRITNSPVWAEVDPASLAAGLRRTYDDRAATQALGARAGRTVRERFSWDCAAKRLMTVGSELRAMRPAVPRRAVDLEAAKAERSPYWMGLRISVVIPTHNRKDKLIACLETLERQTILPQEFEAVVVDDGSTDGTKEALDARPFPFSVRYFRQEGAGPGAARNLGIEHAAGEHVLFIGDDILAGERLLEEHLLAHAAAPEPGVAILGHIDWPQAMTPNAVMEYICGGARLQFAYSLIPKLSVLDHRFFYTSNISLKRQFLLDAAASGVRFDPGFRRAAFEDSEYAFRLIPRGLQIRYADKAHATHDHWVDLDSFAAREFSAGEMAVVFYRKHPGQDQELQVRWIADLVEPAKTLLDQPEFLHHLQLFDSQTDTLLRALAGSLEQLMALDSRPGSSAPISFSAERLRAALNNVLRVVFDVERTRGKLSEWYAQVDDPAKVQAAQTLASVMRKIAFLNLGGGQAVALQGTVGSFDSRAVASLSERIAEIPGLPAAGKSGSQLRQGVKQRLRRMTAIPWMLSLMLDVDRFVEARLQSTARPQWIANYRGLRSRIRRLLT